jgi:glycosyltransferase involved in cell wall biosynthesis
MEDIKLLLDQDKQPRGKLISILLPVFNEEDALPKVFEEMFNYLPNHLPNYHFEITFIDDCSTDNSYQIIVDYIPLSPQNVKLSVFRLAKNSGSHVAITAALNICRGDLVVIMASDGQDPAALIGKLIEEWEKGSEMILALREENRGQSKFRQKISQLSWRLMNWATRVDIDYRGCDVLGLDKIVVRAFNRMNERNTTFIFRVLSLGFQRSQLFYTKRERAGGISKWTFVKKMAIFLDAIAGFSDRPIRLISKLGITFFFILLIRWCLVMFKYYLLNEEPSDLNIILNTIFTTVASQVLLIGVIGDYIWRILDESRKRPLYDFSKRDGETFD